MDFRAGIICEGTASQCTAYCTGNAPVYRQNRRMWTILDTVNFGKVAQIEIGALLVGGIVNDHENVMMRKGAEMGHFELIGSTIVLLFKKVILTCFRKLKSV